MLLPFVMALTLTTMAHCDAVGRGIHAINRADGSHISQCNAITEYIDGHFEGPSLTGTTPKQRAQISMMNLRAENGLFNAVGIYFHHATPGLGPDIETYQCAEGGAISKKKLLDKPWPILVKFWLTTTFLLVLNFP
nr:hypothetical protein [Oceaniovalibus sp. ACAM 378]